MTGVKYLFREIPTLLTPSVTTASVTAMYDHLPPEHDPASDRYNPDEARAHAVSRGYTNLVSHPDLGILTPDQFNEMLAVYGAHKRSAIWMDLGDDHQRRYIAQILERAATDHYDDGGYLNTPGVILAALAARLGFATDGYTPRYPHLDNRYFELLEQLDAILAAEEEIQERARVFDEAFSKIPEDGE